MIGRDCSSVVDDVTEEAAVTRLGEEVAGRFGRWDVLVNNAGKVLFGGVESTDVTTWDTVFNGNIKATWLCTRADVVANVAVIASAVVLRVSGWRFIDPLVGAAIGAYIVKEAWEILRNARAARSEAGTLPALE